MIHFCSGSLYYASIIYTFHPNQERGCVLLRFFFSVQQHTYVCVCFFILLLVPLCEKRTKRPSTAVTPKKKRKITSYIRFPSLFYYIVRGILCVERYMYGIWYAMRREKKHFAIIRTEFTQITQNS